MANTFGFNGVNTLVQAIRNDIDNVVVESLDECATEVVGNIQADTPVLTGALKASITHDEVKQVNNSFSVKVGSSLSYAQPVEEGHQQGPTLVPGRWMIHDNLTIEEQRLNQRIIQKLGGIR